MDSRPAIDSPLAIWTAILIPTVIAVAQAFPQVTGAFQDGWAKWVNGARRTAAAKDDADLAEMQRQVGHLGARVNDLVAEIAERDMWLAEHAKWDALVRSEAAKIGLILPPPPSLWPLKGRQAEPPTAPEAVAPPAAE